MQFKRVALLLFLVAVVSAALAVSHVTDTRPVQAATNKTLLGFRANEGGNGALNLGWTGGNLGNTWAEGEWVPYQFVLTNVQDDFPNLAGLIIDISYDFFASQGQQNARFIDLVRGLQVCTSARSDSQGWPLDNGSAYPMTTRAQLEAAQNDIDNAGSLENQWAGCTLLNLPPAQLDLAVGGGALTPTTARRMFRVLPSDITGAGISPTAGTIVIYWQLHESRTFIWSNSLQSGYASGEAADWGGSIYDEAGFVTDARNGSGFVPGSSGHVHVESLTGSQDVPIPVPPAPGGQICGYKWLDSNGSNTKDGSEPFLSGWRIHAFVTVEGIQFTDSVVTDAQGNYCFTNLTPGTWLIKEASDREVPVETNYGQTYPDLGTVVGVGTGVSVSPPPAGVAGVGWSVALSLSQTTQANMNFGNLIPDARISINPPTGTNEVGTPHPLTCTIEVNETGSFVPAPDGTTCNLSITSGPGSLSASSCQTAGGTGACQVTLTSNQAGTTVVSASTSVVVAGVTLNRTTNGMGGNSGPAQKVWVDARISIAASATNPVGQSHTFTVTVQQNDGLGGGFVPATAGNVDVILTNSNGAVSVLNAASSTCDDNQPSGDNLDAGGQCVVVFTSNSAGQVTGTATVTLVVGGLTLTRSTNGASGNSGPAVKTFVDARISIAQTATNPVGQPHTFTVTVLQNAGDGLGFVAATVGNVDLTLTNSNGANAVLNAASSTCDDAQPDGDNLDAGGQCVVVFTSATGGQVTGTATATLVVGGVTLTRSTNGASGNSGPAVKTFVDARISIQQSGTNFIHSPHTFTVTVQKDAGDGNGFVAASGVTVTGSLAMGSVGSITGGTCTTGPTNGTGQCTLIVNSTVAGTTTVNASATVSVGGLSINVATNGYGAFNISNVKTWIAGTISITKTYQIGPTTNPFGKTACFSLTRTPAPPPPIASNADADGNAANGVTLCHTFVSPTASHTFTWNNVVAGSHTITETTTPAGYATMLPITGIVVDATNLSFAFARTDPLQPGDLRLRKLRGPAPGTAWTGPNVTLYVCAHNPLSSMTELPLASCDSSAEGTQVTLTAAQSTATVTNLAEGYYTVCEFPVPAGYTIPAADQCQVAQVVAGQTGATAASLTFINNPPTEGCTPGFWSGGLGSTMWNTVNDPQWTANGATGTNPFIHTTVFNTFFTANAQLNGVTMFQLVSGGGGNKVIEKTARMLVAAYLSSAAGANNGWTIAQLSAAWTAYLAGNLNDQTLFNQLAAANNLGCPFPR